MSILHCICCIIHSHELWQFKAARVKTHEHAEVQAFVKVEADVLAQIERKSSGIPKRQHPKLPDQAAPRAQEARD